MQNLRENLVVGTCDVGALGSTTKNLGEWTEKLAILLAIELLQKLKILGMAKISRKVLYC